MAAVVDGRLQTRGWKSVLTLHARSVPSGARIASATFAGAPRQLARDITRHLDRRLGRALASAVTGHHHRRLANDARMEPLEQPSARPRPPHAHAVDEEEDEPLAPRGPATDEADADGSDEDGDPPGAARGPEVELRQAAEPGHASPQVLDLSLGLHVFTRHFYYRDPVGTLTPYRLLWAPAPTGTVDWFPFDLVGATATGQIETGATTTDRDGISYPTAHHSASGGVKLRVPLGSAWLTAAGEFGIDVFRIDNADAETPKPPVPSVRYEFARAALALLVRPTSYLTLHLTAGYRHVFDAGEIESPLYFPHASVRGFDAAVTLGVRLRRGLELRVAADFRRYELTLRSRPTDLRMAGSALDDYMGGTVSLALMVGGRRGF